MWPRAGSAGIQYRRSSPREINAASVLSRVHFENKYELEILNLYKSLLLNREKKFKDSQNIISSTNLNTKLKNDKFFYGKLLDLESKNLEKLKNYNEAYKKVEERNNFIFNLDENKKYSGNKILETMEKYKKFYTKKNFSYT